MGFEMRPIKQMEPGQVGAVRGSECGKVVKDAQGTGRVGYVGGKCRVWKNSSIMSL